MKKEIILISGRTKEALDRNTRNIINYLKMNNDLRVEDIAFTLQNGRKEFKYRRSVIANNINEIIDKLSFALNQDIYSIVNSISNNTVFNFKNEEIINNKMFLDAYKNNLMFKRQIDKCKEFLPEKEKILFENFINNKISFEQIRESYFIYDFIFNFSFSKLLIELGIIPYALLGSGINELLCATISDVVSISDSLKILYELKNIRSNIKEENFSIKSNENLFRNISLNSPKIPYISSKTGDWINTSQATDHNYIYELLMNFIGQKTPRKDIIEEIKQNDLVCICFGKDNQFNYNKKNIKVVSIFNLSKDKEEINSEDDQFELFIKKLWESGIKINWNLLYSEVERFRIPLPTYSFEKQKYTVDINLSKLNTMNLKSSEEEILVFERKRDIKNFKEPVNDIQRKILKIFQKVLGIKNISIDENFFDLGGDSLKGIEITSLLQKEFNVKIDIESIFNNSTIEKIAYIITKQNKDKKEIIIPVEEKEYYPIASSQKRIFTLSYFAPDNTAYNLPVAFEITGPLNIKKFKESVKELIKKHESLRTTFHVLNNEPVQKIHKDLKFNISISEKKVLESFDLNKEIKNFVKPFDLSKLPLFRIKILKLPENKYFLLFDIHHIIADGTSLEIIVKDIMNAYYEQIEPLEIQYKDYVVWQKKSDNINKLLLQKEYWINIFNEEIPVLNLPYDFERPPLQSFDGDMISFIINKNRLKKIKRICREFDLTLFMFLFSVYNIFLSKYSNQDDIIIGVPTAGRNIPGLENLIGMFINTLPLRTKLLPNKKISDFFIEVKKQILTAFKNQDYQFDELVDELNLVKDRSRNPLFDTMFVLQNYRETKISLKNLTLKPVEISQKTSKFDISLECREKNDIILCNFEYCTKLFKKQTILRMIKHFFNILDQLILDVDQKISDIEIITEQEKNLILNKFNDTFVKFPENKTLVDLFEKLVKRNGDNIAIIFNNTSFTFNQLNEKSNQIANLIFDNKKEKSKTSGVGLILENSFELAASIIGVLKSGNFYLPVAPDTPIKRIIDIFKESKIRTLIFQSKFKKDIGKIIKEVKNIKNYILIDDVIETQTFYEEIKFFGIDEINKQKKNNLNLKIKNNDLAYIIYTSGSTGKPKGVMIEHGSIYNNIYWRVKNYKFNKNDTSLILFSYHFDGFVTSFFTPLLSGSKIVFLKNNEIKDPDVIIKYLKKYKVTNFITIPSLYLAILSFSRGDELKFLKKVTLAGEKLTKKVVTKSYLINKKIKIFNEYGPTENSVVTTFAKVENGKEITIGKPIANIKVLILNKNNKLLPPGIAGEICISGKGLSRGYINKLELTKKKFIINPYNKREKLYKTGDYGKWQKNGDIFFLGRLDDQIKIRGYRIEPGEIENTLLEYEFIDEALVIPVNLEGFSYLCAYFTAKKKLEIQLIKNFLKDKLPEYMIPSFFIQLKKFPLNSVGKIDKKSLPLPSSQLVNSYVPPETLTQKKLIKILEKILGIKNVGINHNFFEIGGDSIKAINFIVSLNNENININLNDLFKNQTIRELSLLIDSQSNLSMMDDIKLINEKLSKTFGEKIKLVVFYLKNLKINILYLNKEIENKMDKISKFFIENVEVSVHPNFIIMLSSNDSFPSKYKLATDEQFINDVLRLKDISDQKIEKIKLILKQNYNNVNLKLKNNKKLYKFPLSEIQKLHLLKNNRTTGTFVKIDGFLNPETIIKSLIHLINSQELLRSFIIIENEQLFWQVGEKIKQLNIKIIDIADIKLENKKFILKMILEEMLEKKFKVGNLFYNLFIIKYDFSTFYIGTFFDHSIFDGMSVEIVKEFLKESIYRLGKDKLIDSKKTFKYSDYVNLIKKEINSNNLNRIIEMFNLKEYEIYKKLVEEIFEKKLTDEVNLFQYKIPLHNSFEENKIFENSFKIFLTFISRYFNLPKLPVKIIHFGRRYKNNSFYNTIGEFLDFIPLLIDFNNKKIEEIISNVKSLIEFLIENNLNFLTQANQNKTIKKLIAPEKNQTAFILFNFQGKISENEKQLINYFNKNNNKMTKDSIISTFECDVSYDDSFIIFRFITLIKDFTNTGYSLFNNIVKQNIDLVNES